jgi:hypothetical protein
MVGVYEIINGLITMLQIFVFLLKITERHQKTLSKRETWWDLHFEKMIQRVVWTMNCKEPCWGNGWDSWETIALAIPPISSQLVVVSKKERFESSLEVKLVEFVILQRSSWGKWGKGPVKGLQKNNFLNYEKTRSIWECMEGKFSVCFYYYV